MPRRDRPIGEVVLLLSVLLCASSAWAQQASGIAGVARDTSGGVLPGVTVEAASPALIEKVRVVVTDDQGRYNIVDLRPGTYVITFTLPGFNTFRREGITLTAGFTATVNADMQVGALEETITVTGEAPLVDTQNTSRQSVLQDEVLTMLPTGNRNIASLTILMPGLKGPTDVGGTGAVQASSGGGLSFHGKRGRKWSFDGMGIENMQGASNASYILNQMMIEETTIETGGAGAESAMSGVTVNGIPKQGGNTFSGEFRGLFSNEGMQGSNLSDALRDRGLTTVNRLKYIYDVSATLGGPIQIDRLWFFSGVRAFDIQSEVAGIFNNLTPHSPFYTPGTEPAERWESYQSVATRLTWQATTRNKFGFFVDAQPRCDCRRPGNLAPEAQTIYDFWPQGLYQATWTSPVSNRLLLEAGFSFTQSHYTNPPQPGVLPTDISILEQSTGLRYNAATTLRTFTDSHRYAQRFALAYVTGSHAFKTGVYLAEGVQDSEPYWNQSVWYRFNRGVPNQINMHAGPYLTRNRMKAELGIYAQDQWTMDRLTLNYGVRFDYLNAYVKPQQVPATRFLPERDFGPVHKVPEWMDINPRVGAVFDVFGNGRTALKSSLGRHLNIAGLNIAAANNPIEASVNVAARSWNDRDGDYVPDCDLNNFGSNGECGAINNVNFGQSNPSATQWDEAVLRGWHVRDFLWDYIVEVQHEIRTGLSAYVGYNRNWEGNFRVNDNLELNPDDYDPYCITAPVDPRLPGGGGYDVCGLYDLSSEKFGLSRTLVTKAENFGKQSNVNNYIYTGVDARFGNGRLGGGLDTGRQVADSCFVVDSPQQLLNCRIVTGWEANLQIKLNGGYTFPGDLVVSAAFQNIAGPPILADYAASNAEIRASLGRDLSGGRRNATVPLIEPNTVFEGRQTQLDLRLGKLFRLGSTRRFQVNLDLYNALNNSAIATRNNNWGASWGRALSVLDARMLQVSGSFTY